MAGSLLIRIGADVKGLNKGLKSASKRIGRFTKSASRIGAIGAGAAAAGIGAIALATRKATRAAAQYDQSLNELRSSLQRAGVENVDSATASLQEFANQAQFASDHTDDAIMSATAFGASVGIQEKNLKAATQAAMNMSAATGQSLNRSMELIGKSLAGKTSRLENYNVQVDEADVKARGAAATIEAMNEQFAGAAQQNVQNYQGRLNNTSKAWSNVMEATGQAITQNRTVNAVMQVVAKNLNQVASFIGDNQKAISTWVSSGLMKAVGAIDALITGLEFGGKALNAFKIAGNLALAGLIDSFSALTIAHQKVVEGLWEIANFAGMDKIANELHALEGMHRKLRREIDGVGDVFRSTASDGVDAFVSTGEWADRAREKVREFGGDVRRAASEMQFFEEKGVKAFQGVTEKATTLDLRMETFLFDLEEGMDKAAKATEGFEDRLGRVIVAQAKSAAAGESSAKKIIGALAREAAAAAAAWAFRTYPFPASVGIAAGATVAAEGLVAALANFHQGSDFVRRDDLLRGPGMAPNEGVAVLEEGEKVTPKGESGGQTIINNFTETSFMPRTRAHQRHYYHTTVLPVQRQLGIA